MSEFLQKLQEKLGDSVDNFEEIEQIYTEDISGLKNKNLELINGQKKIKEDFDSFKSKFSSVDLDKYAEMQTKFEEMSMRQQAEEENKAKEKGDMEFFKKQAESRHNKAMESWNKEKESILVERDLYKNKFQSKLIDLDLTNELKNVNVSDKYIPYVKAMFGGKAFVSPNDEGVDQVMIKDESGADVPLKDYVDAWSMKEEAKAVIVEPTTLGTGSKGSSSGNVSRKQQLQEQINEAMEARDSLRVIALQRELGNLG